MFYPLLAVPLLGNFYPFSAVPFLGKITHFIYGMFWVVLFINLVI